jgi:hypothetical protein
MHIEFFATAAVAPGGGPFWRRMIFESMRIESLAHVLSIKREVQMRHIGPE